MSEQDDTQEVDLDDVVWQARWLRHIWKTRLGVDNLHETAHCERISAGDVAVRKQVLIRRLEKVGPTELQSLRSQLAWLETLEIHNEFILVNFDFEPMFWNYRYAYETGDTDLCERLRIRFAVDVGGDLHSAAYTWRVSATALELRKLQHKDVIQSYEAELAWLETVKIER